MNGVIKDFFKLVCRRAVAVFCALAVCGNVQAAQKIPVLECKVQDDNLVMYLQRSGDAAVASIQFGTEKAEIRVGEQATSTVTWILYDNSYSIPYADQTMAKAVLSNLVEQKSPNEVVNLCTFGEHYVMLFQESDDGSALASAINSIQHNNQETYLTDVLAELLDYEENRADDRFVRIVVFSDGVDNNPSGITRNELYRRLQESNIPVYTIGSVGDGKSSLKEMYELSRETNARWWDLANMDPESFYIYMRYDLMPQRAVARIPESAQNGSRCSVLVTFPDGATAEAEVKMPYGNPPQPPPPPPSSEENFNQFTDNTKNKQHSLVWILVLIVILLLLAGSAATYFLLQRQREQKKFRTPNNDIRMEPRDSSSREGTDILNQGGGQVRDQEGTMILVSDDIGRVLSLTDLDQPERQFSSPIRDSVTIGRNQSNQIVLDYDRSVSGRHCEIFQSGSDFRIRDLHSSNGTYVDDIRVIDESSISNGCTIKLGRLSLRVTIR